jgi:hypothetical protein
MTLFLLKFSGQLEGTRRTSSNSTACLEVLQSMRSDRQAHEERVEQASNAAEDVDVALVCIRFSKVDVSIFCNNGPSEFIHIF